MVFKDGKPTVEELPDDIFNSLIFKEKKSK